MKINDATVSEIVNSGCEVLRDGHEDGDGPMGDLLMTLRTMVSDHGLKAVLESIRDACDCSADAVEGRLFEDNGCASALRAISGHVSSAAKVIK